MPRLALALLLTLACTAELADAQTRRRTPVKPAAPKPPAVKTEPAEAQCPSVLGQGVMTLRVYCDVLSSINPAEGVLIPVPARTGSATLTFDLHNRHT